jgi:stage III sporulation protein SpoIIIAA
MQNLEIDGLEKLLSILPYWMRYLVRDHASTLEEICLDVGKNLCFKLTEGFTTIERVISQDDLEQVMCEVGMVRSDGRTGVSGTLHRVAAITNRYGVVTGYTIRIGRYLESVASPLREVILKPKASVALFGPPGSGKTTLLRGVAGILAQEFGPRLCVVDSSNEIAGDGDTAHPLLRAARRLQVPDPKDLADKLVEALINHGPSVMLVDELARPDDVSNIIRVIQRGVRVIACLHGDTLEEVVRNPDYEPLLGIINGQRKTPTVLTSAVELKERGVYCHYSVLARAVDDVLSETTPSAMWLPLDTLSCFKDDLLATNESFPYKPIEDVVADVVQRYMNLAERGKLELQLLGQQGLCFLKEVRGANLNRA